MQDTPPRASEATPELGRATLTKVGWRLLAVPAAALRRRVARPRQHRLRGAADERRSGLQRHRLRLRRRHLLHRLRAVRGAEQLDPRARRRAAVDRAHHDHVGHLVGRDDVRGGADQLLRAAVSARRRRSRFLARHHLLPRQLVSGEGPSARGLVVHARDSAVDGHRRAARGRHSRARRLARPRKAGSGCSCSKAYRPSCSASSCSVISRTRPTKPSGSSPTERALARRAHRERAARRARASRRRPQGRARASDRVAARPDLVRVPNAAATASRCGSRRSSGASRASATSRSA